MTPFIAGALFGGVMVAAVFAAFLAVPRRHRCEIEVWREDAYQPPVTTTLTINRRQYTL